MGFSRKKKCNPPVEDINEKFQGGVHQKLRKKIQGVKFKKLIFSTGEGGTIFWKSPIFTQDITFNSNEDEESSIHQSGVCPPY